VFARESDHGKRKNGRTYRLIDSRTDRQRAGESKCVTEIQIGTDDVWDRMPYLHRSFSAKEPYNQWLFCEK